MSGMSRDLQRRANCAVGNECVEIHQEEERSKAFERIAGDVEQKCVEESSETLLCAHHVYKY